MSERYQNGATIPITVTALDGARAKVTGLTDVLLTIRRETDDQYFDFDDSTFKASGWVDRDLQMGEKDSTNSPGVYFYDWNTTGLSDDEYHLEVSSATAANSPWAAWAYVGDYVDNIVTAFKILKNKLITDPSTGILTVYDDDDSVLLTANIYEDVAAATAYRGKGIERRNRLT